jgi:uncharacterized protein (TIGR02266 family)
MSNPTIGTDLATDTSRQEVAMIPASSPVVDVFREYSKLYALRNSKGGSLDAQQEKEWNEIRFTMESIFSGMYQPEAGDLNYHPTSHPDFRSTLPLQFLRVPTDTDVLCETTTSFFSGRLQDISTGGAYVHAASPLDIESRVKLTFCTFRNSLPLEIDCRVAWNNTEGQTKSCYLEGAGVQFVEYDKMSKRQLEDFVYELVEETLIRANLI